MQSWLDAQAASNGRRPMYSQGGIAEKSLIPDSARGRFVINVGSNIGYVALNTALMVWYVPFLMHHLGEAAYGMIPLTNSLVTYAAIISDSLNASINRFLAIDLNNGNDIGANRTFNSALALSVAACGTLVLLVGIITYLFPVLFNIPPGLERAAQFLFAAAGVTILTAVLSGPFGAISLITHRFDLRNVISSLTLVIRIGVVAVCFSFWPASLWYVAAGIALAAPVSMIGDMLFWRLLAPQLQIDRCATDPERVRELIGLSGWVMINSVGLVLLMQTALIIVNTLFGAEMTGRYGALLLFPTLIETMTGTVVSVLSPAIMARYAVGDIEGMRRIVSRSVKLLGIGLALPIGLLCGFGRPLLGLWLGPGFGELDLLLILLVGHLTVNLAIRPLLYVITAYNRLKVQGVLTIALGAANVVLAVAFARWGGLGAAGVAAATAIVWTLKNVVFLSSYAAGLMRLPWWTFYAPLTAGALGMLGTAFFSRLVSQLWWPSSWLVLGAMATAIGAVYATIAYTISLNRSDRDLLWSLLRRRSYDQLA